MDKILNIKTPGLITLAILLTMPVSATQNTKEKLTVYTYSSFASEWGPGPKVEAEFEKSCACDLEFIALDDGVSVLNRLRLEGGNTEADILLGLDDSLIDTAKKTGLLAEHNIDLSGANLNSQWSDNVFLPYDYGYFSFIYNNEKLKNPPTSLKELIEERSDLSVIYQDPRSSTPGLGLMLWVKSIYGDEADSAWKKLAAKTVTVTKGWTEAYGMFLKGEADMVLSYTTSPAYHMIAENEHKYVAASFSEGHYRQTEVAAIVKSSQHKKLAKQFMSFMLSDAFQSQIPTGNWMYPVTNVALPAQFEKLVKPVQVLSFSSEEITKKRKIWSKEWLNSVTN